MTEQTNLGSAQMFVTEVFPSPTARQQVSITRLLSLAAAMDREVDGSKLASLSREHRQVMSDLAQHQLSEGRPVDAHQQPGDAAGRPADAPANVVSEDKVAEYRASIADKRRPAQ